MQLTSQFIQDKLVIKQGSAKTFVFDLDGTLIYNGQPLSPQFAKLLQKIKAAGHEVVFATGRSWRDFVPVVPAWCSEQPSVLCGGGLAIANAEIKCQHFLKNQYLQEVIQILEDNHLHYLLDGKTNYYHPAKEHWLYQNIIELSGQQKTHTLDSALNDEVYKILVLDAEWMTDFKNYIVGKDLLLKHHSYDKCFDIMPADVNKFNALSCLELPAVEDIFVFGNDHNDLELMQELPNSIMFGYHPELLQHAKIQIEYDGELATNFACVINSILKKC